MGGGQSAPSFPKRKVIRPNSDPAHNINQGLQIKKSEGCSECTLIIDRGISSSSATIIINPEPDGDGNIPMSATDTTTTVANIYQPSNSITIKPSSPFTGSFNPKVEMPYGISTVWWDTMDLFWGAPLRAEGSGGPGVQGDACLLVRSSTAPIILMIPIMKTGDATKKGTKFFSVLAPTFLALSGRAPATSSYDPTQDPHIAGDWAKLGAGDTSVDKTKVNDYIHYASDGHYDTGEDRPKPKPYATRTVDTGNDWSLHSLVTGKEAYYTWIHTIYSLQNDGEMNESVGLMIFDTTYLKWASTKVASNQTMGNLTPRVVYFQEPIYILNTDFASLRGSVDARPPSEVIQTLSAYDKTNPNDPNHVYYHPACCGAAGSQDTERKSTATVFSQIQAQQSLDTWNRPEMQVFVSILIVALMFFVLSWLLTYINEDPNNIFAIIGHTIRPPPVNT